MWDTCPDCAMVSPLLRQRPFLRQRPLEILEGNANITNRDGEEPATQTTASEPASRRLGTLEETSGCTTASRLVLMDLMPTSQGLIQQIFSLRSAFLPALGVFFFIFLLLLFFFLFCFLFLSMVQVSVKILQVARICLVPRIFLVARIIFQVSSATQPNTSFHSSHCQLAMIIKETRLQTKHVVVPSHNLQSFLDRIMPKIVSERLCRVDFVEKRHGNLWSAHLPHVNHLDAGDSFMYFTKFKLYGRVSGRVLTRHVFLLHKLAQLIFD
jgi:hypothetical protein